MMAFVLIYVPCLATVAVIRRETNSWKWAAFSQYCLQHCLGLGCCFCDLPGWKGNRVGMILTESLHLKK
ncbi:MAG: hypothetical protein KAU38_14640 [Desulfobacterales bacterium]|nr:hypothetical protein [Desulfobacterales bacterium]